MDGAGAPQIAFPVDIQTHEHAEEADIDEGEKAEAGICNMEQGKYHGADPHCPCCSATVGQGHHKVATQKHLSVGNDPVSFRLQALS